MNRQDRASPRAQGLLERAASFLEVRPGEGPTALLFCLCFFLLASSQYAAKSVRQASWIDALGADQLPWAYLLVAVSSLPVVLLYTRLAERAPPHRMLLAYCIVHGAALAVFYDLLGRGGAWVPVALYVWVTIAFGVGVSQLWSYAHFVFDARQARRLFALVAAGGLLGGVPGGILARLVAAGAGTRAVLAVAAGIVLSAGAVVLLIERVRPASSGPRSVEGHSAGLARQGLQTVGRSRLLRLIAILVALGAVAAQMIDLQFNWVIEAATQGLDERTAVYGTFFSAMGLVAFAIQLLLTRWIHRRHGVSVGLRVLPVTVAATASALLLALVLAPAFILPVAWSLKLGETGLRHSIDQSTRELLFLPLPARLRRRGKTFIDLFVQRAARAAAALLLLPATFGLLGLADVALLTIGVVMGWLGVVAATRREYVQAFRDGLRAPVSDALARLDTHDVTTLRALVEALGSPRPREVLHAIDLLASSGEGRLVSPLLVRHDVPEVRRRAIEVLTAGRRSDAAHLIEPALGDTDPRVRSAAVQALAVLGGAGAAERMRAHLDEANPRSRAAAVAFLLDGEEESERTRAAQILGEMVADADSAVRRAAAEALGWVTRWEGRHLLVDLLYDADPEVVRPAIAAVLQRLERGDASPLYVPILIALTATRRLRHDARAAIVGYGEAAIPSLVLFMSSCDEAAPVRRSIPKALALIGGDAAVAALIEALALRDPLLRGPAIEALAFLRRCRPTLQVPEVVVRTEIRCEARHYLQYLCDLIALRHGVLRMRGPRVAWAAEDEPTLLHQVLSERIAGSIEQLFRLLELLLDPADVAAARRGLLGPEPFTRARALEYLDNTLPPALRSDVGVVIGDEPPAEKARRWSSGLEVALETPERTLRRLLSAGLDRHSGRLGVTVAALYALDDGPRVALQLEVGRLAEESPEPLVRETAIWLLRRRSATLTVAKLGGAGGGGWEERTMSGLARIEMMEVLREVDLFAHCTAEQVLRIAAITRELSVEKGTVLYRRRDPANALYCVVTGRVAVGDGDHAGNEVGPGERFGAIDILTGRLRTSDAEALAPTRLLVIAADDLLDLLANNIEIVKAIFRCLAVREDDRAGSST